MKDIVLFSLSVLYFILLTYFFWKSSVLLLFILIVLLFFVSSAPLYPTTYTWKSYESEFSLSKLNFRSSETLFPFDTKFLFVLIVAKIENFSSEA